MAWLDPLLIPTMILYGPQIFCVVVSTGECMWRFLLSQVSQSGVLPPLLGGSMRGTPNSEPLVALGQQ